MTDTPMLDAAAVYAARGWPVFPLHTPQTFGPKEGADRATCSCSDPTCNSQGKHPRIGNGLDGATTDADQIARWWARWPDANIGIRTGVAFDVLDLDGPDALDALDALKPDAAAVVGPMVVTGRGIHIYVHPTGHGNRTAMRGYVGLDWRGAGGYVVAPPSLHYLHGDRYDWGSIFGIDTATGAVPHWLASVVAKPRKDQAPPSSAEGTTTPGSRYGERALDAEVGKVARAPEGTRNHALNVAAFSLGQLVAGGELDAATVASALVTVASRIGLTEGEAVATIRSGMAAGMAEPRTAGATK